MLDHTAPLPTAAYPRSTALSLCLECGCECATNTGCRVTRSRHAGAHAQGREGGPQLPPTSTRFRMAETLAVKRVSKQSRGHHLEPAGSNPTSPRDLPPQQQRLSGGAWRQTCSTMACACLVMLPSEDCTPADPVSWARTLDWGEGEGGLDCRARPHSALVNQACSRSRGRRYHNVDQQKGVSVPPMPLGAATKRGICQLVGKLNDNSRTCKDENCRMGSTDAGE